MEIQPATHYSPQTFNGLLAVLNDSKHPSYFPYRLAVGRLFFNENNVKEAMKVYSSVITLIDGMGQKLNGEDAIKLLTLTEGILKDACWGTCEHKGSGKLPDTFEQLLQEFENVNHPDRKYRLLHLGDAFRDSELFEEAKIIYVLAGVQLGSKTARKRFHGIHQPFFTSTQLSDAHREEVKFIVGLTKDLVITMSDKRACVWDRHVIKQTLNFEQYSQLRNSEVTQVLKLENFSNHFNVLMVLKGKQAVLLRVGIETNDTLPIHRINRIQYHLCVTPTQQTTITRIEQRPIQGGQTIRTVNYFFDFRVAL